MKKFNQAWLPYIAAFVQAIMFSYAGVQYFGAWGWAIGPGVGVVVSTSLAVASSRISEIAQKRQRLARVMYYGLFVLSPATIALTLFLPTSVWTAIAWAAAPDIAIGLAGSIAGGSLLAKDPKPLSETERPLKSAQRKKKSLSKPLSEIACRYAGAGCERTFAQQNAANAHARTCGFKPTIAMPVDVSEKQS